MNLSAAGAAFLRTQEGFVDHYYLDPVGIGTIGIGFTWRSDAFRAWWRDHRPGVAFGIGARMTREEADACLQFIVGREYGPAVNEALGKIAQSIFDGAVSPVYNLGAGALSWQWAAAVKRGELHLAADLLADTGITAKNPKTGKRIVLQGLVTRRREEGELIECADYAPGPPENDPMADGTLIRGERGDAVADLQRSLATLKFYVGVVDGRFGYGTEAAVLLFQRANGLKLDGWAGPATLKAIQAAA